MRDVSLIFAMASNGVIGRAGGLPWDFPEDRAHFARTTHGHAVVMGRRTWEETGKPLEGRTNIVVSTTLEQLEGARVVRSLSEGLALAWEVDAEPFVIGGVRLFEEALPLATRIFVTDVPGAYEGDAVLRFDRGPFRIVSSRGGDRGLVFSVLEPDLREETSGELLDRYYAELVGQMPHFERPPADPRAISIVAYQNGRPAACGSLRQLDPTTFEVKRMFVLPEARGAGHARRLLAALERRAYALGAARIVLDTAAPLEAAIRLYHRAGYREIERYNDNPAAAHWFEKRLRP